MAKPTARSPLVLSPEEMMRLEALAASRTASVREVQRACCVASPVAGLVAVKMAEAVCRWSPTWEGGVFRSGASL